MTKPRKSRKSGWTDIRKGEGLGQQGTHQIRERDPLVDVSTLQGCPGCGSRAVYRNGDLDLVCSLCGQVIYTS